MKNAFLSLLLPALLLLAGYKDARAAGIGVYGTYSGGRADWDPSEELSFKKDTTHRGAGIAFDSAPATDRLFNYQMNIGYERFENRNSNAWGNASFEGMVLSNNFGFGGLITPTTRFWMGPELRLAWANGHPDDYPGYKIRMFGLGLGPVAGLNFNIGESQTFVVKAGFQYITYRAHGDGFYSHRTNQTTTDQSYDYDMTEKMFYVTLEYLFRTSGDRK